MGQMPLAIQLDDFAVFESFFPARNQEIYQLLSELDGSSDRFDGFWLWGETASGKSHLLQAVSDNMVNNCVYIPMKELISHNPHVIEDLSSRKIVCIDDIDLCAGKREWELAIFNLCNQLLDRKLSLVASSSSKVFNSGFILILLSPSLLFVELTELSQFIINNIILFFLSKNQSILLNKKL